MLWLLAILALTVVVVVIRARFWPYGPCPACQGRRGRGIGSRPQAYNRCGRCGGKGERIRPLALMWARHREEAKRRKR